MEVDRVYCCLTNSSQGSQRPQGSRNTRDEELNPMDYANRRSLKESTAAVSTAPNMLQAVPTMDAAGSFSTHSQRAG